MSFHGDLVGNAQQVVDAVVGSVDPDRVGCCLYVVESPTREGLEYAIPTVFDLFYADGVERNGAGVPSAWKINAPEKVNRAVKLGDESSWPSRDRAKKQYGGAIIFEFVGKWYGFGISGFSEHSDEAACFVLAVLLGMVTSKYVRKVAFLSGNDKILPLMHHLSQTNSNPHLRSVKNELSLAA